MNHKIDMNLLILLSPKRESPKQSRGYYPASTCQGRVFIEAGMPV